MTGTGYLRDKGDNAHMAETIRVISDLLRIPSIHAHAAFHWDRIEEFISRL
jgi:hypothetical protein